MGIVYTPPGNPGAGTGGGTTSVPVEWSVEFTADGSLAGKVGAGTQKFPVKGTNTITRVVATVGGASAGAAIIVDVRKNGTTIFTNQAHRPSIAPAAFVATQGTIDVSALADGDLLTADIAQIGTAGNEGSDLVVTVYMVKIFAGTGSGSGAGVLPAGGSTLQALLKQSNADGDTGWATITPTLVGLANVQNVDQTVGDNITSGTVAAARLGTLGTLGTPVDQIPAFAGLKTNIPATGVSPLSNYLAHPDGRVDYNRTLTCYWNNDRSITSSTTFVVDPYGKLRAGALCNYSFHVELRYTASATGDLKVSWSVPGFGSVHYTAVRLDAGDAVVVGDDNTGTVIAGGAGATERTLTLDGIIVGDLSDGTFQLQWAQNTSDGTATVVKSGSLARFQQISALVPDARGEHYNVLFLGDSITEGSDSGGGYRANPFPRRMRRMLAGLLGLRDGGPGFRPLTRLDEWSFTGSFTTNTDKTAAYNKYPFFQARFTNSNAAIYKWTKPANEAPQLRAYLYFVRGTSWGDLQYRVDGGEWTVAGLTGATDNSLQILPIEQPIISTIEVRNNQSGGTLYLVGAAFYDGFSGLVCHNFGSGGRQASDLLGGSNGADGLAIMNQFAHRLAYINFGANEAILSVAPATFATNLASVVGTFTPNGAVIQHSPPLSNPANGLGNFNTAYANNEAQVSSAAASAHRPFASIDTLFGSWATANGNSLMQDDFHPNQAGHDLIANYLMRLTQAAV